MIREYPPDRAAAAFAAQLTTLSDVLNGLSDDDLLAPSRCRGWAVCDVVCHVHLGLQEMLCGFATTTDAPADTDFATYWRAFPPGAGGSPAAVTRFLRLMSSAYSQPSRLIEHLGRTTTALLAVAGRVTPGQRVAFQGHVLPVGDFVATWVLELAVHQLDVTVAVPAAAAPTPEALAVTTDTLEALAPGLAKAGWDDVTRVLKATGRVALDDADRDRLGTVAERLPVLG